MKKLSTTFLFTFLSIWVYSQYQIGLVPKVSPDRGVYEKIAFTEINITYGSPRVNARDIWGDLVPYNEVWRAGANEATTVEFSEDVMIEGKALNKGKYAFYVIPKAKGKWTVIFNRQYKQWGAYNYDQSEDAIRVKVPVNDIEYTENLAYYIEGIDYEYGFISLLWETKKIELEVKTNYISILNQRVQEKLEKSLKNLHWVIYLQAAEFLLLEDKELDTALNWINSSEQLAGQSGEWHPQYYPKEYILGHVYWTKANILAQMGDFKEALDYVGLLKNIQHELSFYEEENKYGDLDYYIEEWESLLKND